MIGAPLVEQATFTDLRQLARLRRQFGWSHATNLLAAIHHWDGGRIFLIRERQLIATPGTGIAPAAAIVATAAPPKGVIGSVMVRADFQKRGLGRIIMEQALAWLRQQGVHHVYLDATPAGRPLYRRLGFVDATSSWYTATPIRLLDTATLSALSGGMRAHKAESAALDSIAALDLAAFGGNRIGLLRELLRSRTHALYIACDANDQPAGFTMTRRPEAPTDGVRIGPLVARDDAAAAALVMAALDHERRVNGAQRTAPESRKLVASIAGDNPRALAFFRAIGAEPIEDDLIMRLDMPDGDQRPCSASGHTAEQPSVYSWIAPMVF